jgi:ABC-2 type transport system ATP-binding protein
MLTPQLDVALAAGAAAARRDPDPAISVRGLRKAYGSRVAVQDVDLEVRRGEIVAVLGPNGAGKTTAVSILEGFLTADAGEVRVLGEDPARASAGWRERVGIVLQASAPEPELTVRECLELHAGWYRHPRAVGETLALAGLTDRAERRGGQLSGGERRRLDVALALVGDPELVFLDEPTTGFDPAARREAWAVVAGLRDLGVTVVLTTHYLEEAERLADRIVVLRDGRVIAEGTPRSLGARDRAAALVTWTGADGIPRELRSTTLAADLHALTAEALERGHDLADLEVRRPTLEDVYLELTAQTPSPDA